MAIFEVSSPMHDPADLHGASAVLWSYFPSPGYSMRFENHF
jgi:hypothetical protein